MRTTSEIFVSSKRLSMNELRMTLERRSENKKEEIFISRNFKKKSYEYKVNYKFYDGLNSDEIDNLEKLFDFKFPKLYRQMLSSFRNFYRETISIDLKGNEEIIKICRLYDYPSDLKEVRWLVNQIYQYIGEIKSVIKENGFDDSEIEGFIPIYSHRVLVVFKNKALSPVISIYDNDIIIYGNDLKDYLINEFGTKR
ncbi:hypothetical protein EV142_103166 [Flavobacterium circumlabens]|uniref:SMI1/KNR4 family protein n=2 Tax=Flavobacterium circumlabens TaxID=2133765 RepID=A0ABY2AZV0_9FLAO|nr:hypothetical protein EV142_103166 [Flavobacterium circumlabens]